MDNSPLRVAVEHLSEPKERQDDDVLRATQIQLVSTLRDLVQLHPLYSEQLRAFAGFGGDFENVARLADVCASLTSADSEQLQKILEELDATQRCVPACTLVLAGWGPTQADACHPQSTSASMPRRAGRYGCNASAIRPTCVASQLDRP